MERIGRTVNQLKPRKLRNIFDNPDSTDAPCDLILTEPSSTRRSPVKRIASRHIFELIWERSLHQQVVGMKYFYNLFRPNEVTAVSAGWIFEYRMHDLLRTKQAIRLSPIAQARPGPVNFIHKEYTEDKSVTTELASSAEYLLVEADDLLENHYYRPEASNFPAADSFILIRPSHDSDPILLIFQMTLNTKSHDVNEAGLRRIHNFKLPAGTRMYYVVITPEGVKPKITIPKEYFGMKGKGKLGDDRIRVFNYDVSEGELFHVAQGPVFCNLYHSREYLCSGVCTVHLIPTAAISMDHVVQGNPRAGDFIFNDCHWVAGSGDHLLVEGGGFHPNHYCRPKRTDFLAIDTLLLLPGSPVTTSPSRVSNRTKLSRT